MTTLATKRAAAKAVKTLDDKAYKIASRATAVAGPVPIMKLADIHKAAKDALLAGDTDDAALAKTIAYVNTIPLEK